MAPIRALRKSQTFLDRVKLYNEADIHIKRHDRSGRASQILPKLVQTFTPFPFRFLFPCLCFACILSVCQGKMKGDRGRGRPRPLALALTFSWLTLTCLAIEVDQDGCVTQVVLVEEENDK